MAIQVKEQPKLSHSGPFFRDGFISSVIIGKSGCGKTNLLLQMLPTISPNIKTIVIATKVAKCPAHLAIKEYFKKIGRFCDITNDPDQLRAFTELCSRTNRVTPTKQGLIIFDDFNDGKATGPFWNMIIHAFTKLRNEGWNFIILAQQSSFVPPIVRNCTTSRVLFDCYAKSARDCFVKDFADRLANPLVLQLLLTYLEDVQYTFMLVRENPFEISAGSNDSTNLKSVFSKGSVVMPTLKEIKDKLGVTNMDELTEKTRKMQINAGNTARELFE
jgi:energy-coupling factor transporter ATP-binding protein EcfA2